MLRDGKQLDHLTGTLIDLVRERNAREFSVCSRRQRRWETRSLVLRMHFDLSSLRLRGRIPKGNLEMARICSRDAFYELSLSRPGSCYFSSRGGKNGDAEPVRICIKTDGNAADVNK